MRRGKKNLATRLMFTGAFAIYGLICIFMMATNSAANNPSLTFHLWFPIVFCAILIFTLAYTKLFRSKVPGARLRAGISLLLLGVVLFGLFEIQVMIRRMNPSSGSIWESGWLVPHAGWLFLTSIVMIAGFVNQQALKKKMWAGQATLQRAKTADISAEGLCISDAVSRLEYRWQAFAGWRETKTLFVIFLSEYQVIFLPKHAFDSPEKVEAMRALAGLIQSPAASAFPVVQTHPPPPLPADHQI